VVLGSIEDRAAADVKHLALDLKESAFNAHAQQPARRLSEERFAAGLFCGCGAERPVLCALGGLLQRLWLPGCDHTRGE